MDNAIKLRAGWEGSCLLRHSGVWLMEPRRFVESMQAYRAGRLQPVAAAGDSTGAGNVSRSGSIAVVRLAGSLMKAQSKFGGSSTVEARQALRAATNDPNVSGIMLYFDESPGGHASGTDELAAEVRRAAAVKPFRVHADDLVASAAYWPAAQAPVGSFSVNRMADVGSIGVYAVVQDVSEAMEEAGIKTFLVASGEAKGDFVPGLPVTKEALGRLQEHVDRMHMAFVQAVANGRQMDVKEVARLATGQTYAAEEAVELGLVDRVMSMEEALADLAEEIANTRRANGGRRRQAMARLSIEEQR